MKKICTFISVFVCAIFLSACVSTKGPTPYGVWKSDDPSIILYLDPSQKQFSGIYVKDDKEIEVSILFTVYDDSFIICDPETKDTINAYFAGTFKIKKGDLYYKLSKGWREKTGYETIVFEKIVDYPISSSSGVID